MRRPNWPVTNLFTDCPKASRKKDESTMSKKHFIALANTLKQLKPACRELEPHPFSAIAFEEGKIAKWEETVTALANYCYVMNPQFNRGRWLAYINGDCGPNGARKK